MASSQRFPLEASVRSRIAPLELVLRDWGLLDRPLSSLLALGLAIGLGCLAGWAAESLAIGLFLGAALVTTLWRTWMPVKYELGISGIAQVVFGWRQQIPWAAIKSHEIRADGVRLLADAARATSSPLRGIYLHFGAHRCEVCAHLQYYLQDWYAPAVAATTRPDGSKPA